MTFLWLSAYYFFFCFLSSIEYLLYSEMCALLSQNIMGQITLSVQNSLSACLMTTTTTTTTDLY